ncbi:hypothetical protein ES705_49498 [subsurface metagenome]
MAAAKARAEDPEAEVPRPLPISSSLVLFKKFREIKIAFVFILE